MALNLTPEHRLVRDVKLALADFRNSAPADDPAWPLVRELEKAVLNLERDQATDERVVQVEMLCQSHWFMSKLEPCENGKWEAGITVRGDGQLVYCSHPYCPTCGHSGLPANPQRDLLGVESIPLAPFGITQT